MSRSLAIPTPPAQPLFLCVGDIDVDVLIEVDRLPARDGKVNGQLLQRVPGGMAGNVSVGFARLGGRVRILGRVGEDEEAAFALAGLANAGVDIGFIVRLAGARTFSCIGLIIPDGERSLVKLMTPTYRPDAHDPDSEAAWVAAVVARYGRIDAIGCNAGMILPKTVIEASATDMAAAVTDTPPEVARLVEVAVDLPNTASVAEIAVNARVEGRF